MEHEHTHTHDGVEHSHPHTHDHGHEHEHNHGHEHCQEHIHCGEHMNCADCGHEHISPREELLALMKYMVGHNQAHANELAQLAKQLQDAGEATAYEQVMLAVSDFEKGNLRLSTVLASLQK